MASPDTKVLTSIQQQLQPLLPALEQAAQAVHDQQVSNYPIFLLYRGDHIELGIPIVTHEVDDQWNIHISTLEELVVRSIMEKTKVDDFRKLYKSKSDHLCLLLWEAGEAQFVFLPTLKIEDSE